MTEVSLVGPCEWCGGPQSWTIIGGEVYTSCDGGCLPLPLPGLVPPPDSLELIPPEETPNGTYVGEGGSRPYEGADRNTSGSRLTDDLPF